jgi:aspartate carbamoyltransferase regulatory subunit
MKEDRLIQDEKAIKVSALRHGTVIDHLARGTGLKVLFVLGLEERIGGGTVAIGLNLESSKLGQKDLIKIEDHELKQAEVDKIALLSPAATLSIIRNFKVIRKFRPEIPDALEAVVRCTNPSCISNHEKIASRFSVVHRAPLRLRCNFCERAIAEEDIELL